MYASNVVVTYANFSVDVSVVQFLIENEENSICQRQNVTG